MKLAVIVFAAFLMGCGAQQSRPPVPQRLVTSTEAIPGKSYEVVGVVTISGDDVYETCASPQSLVRVAFKQYGDFDAIVNFRKSKGSCDDTALGQMCWDACEGTAVRFTASR